MPVQPVLSEIANLIQGLQQTNPRLARAILILATKIDELIKEIESA